MSELQNLINAIGDILGPTSGLDCDEVDHNELIKVMERYISNEEEWAPYNLSDLSRNYTRNLIDETNGKSNILLVCWVRVHIVTAYRFGNPTDHQVESRKRQSYP